VSIIDNILNYFEQQAFGVCEWWGEKLNINSNSIRVYFIYLSFLTLGSPLVVYLVMAFVLENKTWFKPKKQSIWEL
jgi:phage shock protein PspC (stress-responsive transcriptional regulator)